MAFKVVLSADDVNFKSYGDDDVYKLPASGKLYVEVDGGAHKFVFNNWIYLQADADHSAGGPRRKPGSGERTAIVL